MKKMQYTQKCTKIKKNQNLQIEKLETATNYVLSE